mmetsp:Transcript_35235/g.42046  ORF Transcript_35235/g.42046 Transcript_35235/m.42046 type:complete len:82 (+) Transcript_35235:126-371(+)
MSSHTIFIFNLQSSIHPPTSFLFLLLQINQPPHHTTTLKQNNPHILRLQRRTTPIIQIIIQIPIPNPKLQVTHNLPIIHLT